MIYTKGTWNTIEDLKLPDEKFSDAFARFLDSENCPPFLNYIIKLSKDAYDKKIEKSEGTSNRDESRSNNQQQYSQESSIFGSHLSYNCLLYTSPSPRDKRQSRMPSSA